MTTDKAIAALGGEATARAILANTLRVDNRYVSQQERNIADLALAALDAHDPEREAKIEAWRLVMWDDGHDDMVRRRLADEAIALMRSAPAADRLRQLRELFAKARDRNQESFQGPSAPPVGNLFYERVAVLDWVLKEIDRLLAAAPEPAAAPAPDPRDAEIAALKAENERLRQQQNEVAVLELEEFGKDALNLRWLPSEAPVQVVRDLVAEKLRCRIAALSEKPAEPPAAAAPSLTAPTDRDWTEDAGGENGSYQGKCVICGSGFIGHKRRVVCRTCHDPAAAAPEKPAEPEPDDGDEPVYTPELIRLLGKVFPGTICERCGSGVRICRCNKPPETNDGTASQESDPEVLPVPAPSAAASGDQQADRRPRTGDVGVVAAERGDQRWVAQAVGGEGLLRAGETVAPDTDAGLVVLRALLQFGQDINRGGAYLEHVVATLCRRELARKGAK